MYEISTLRGCIYLEHDSTDVINALGYRLSGSRNRDCSLCGVGQHFRSDLYRGACNFSDLLDLGSTLSNQRTTLTGRDDQPQSNRRSGYSTASTIYILELGTPLREPTIQQHINKHTLYRGLLIYSSKY